MKKASRKEQILGFLRRQTTTLLQAQGESCIGISAQQIAEDLGYDRANVSKELNAKASSGGSIRYKGEGLIRDIKVGSGGTVRRF